jgi:hypothetical protein
VSEFRALSTFNSGPTPVDKENAIGRYNDPCPRPPEAQRPPRADAILITYDTLRHCGCRLVLARTWFPPRPLVNSRSTALADQKALQEGAEVVSLERISLV